MKSLLAPLSSLVLLLSFAASSSMAAPAAYVRLPFEKLWPLPGDWVVDNLMVGPPHPDGVAIAGQYAFLRDSDPALRAVDVSDPANPLLTGTLTLPNDEAPAEIIASGQQVYMRYYAAFERDPAGGIHIINVSDPANPAIAGTYTSGKGLSAFEVSGPRIYAAWYEQNAAVPSAGLSVLDVSDPAKPVTLGVCSNLPRARGLAVLNNRVYLAGARELHIIDVSDPRTPVEAGRFSLMAEAMDVAIAGDHAFVVTGPSGDPPTPCGLEIISVSNPGEPRPVSSHPIAGGAARVVLHGPYACMVTRITPNKLSHLLPSGYDFHIVDISDPASPGRVDRPQPGPDAFELYYSPPISEIAVANGHLYDPRWGLYRFQELPATGPALSMHRQPQSAALSLQVSSPGGCRFTLSTSTNLADWHPVRTVFSRLDEYSLGVEVDGPCRFYRAAEIPPPAALAAQWSSIGIPRYSFRFERLVRWGHLSGTATVVDGKVTEAHDVYRNFAPVAEAGVPQLLPEFRSIEQLLLNAGASGADLTTIQWNAQQPHIPELISMDYWIAAFDDEVDYLISELAPLE